MSVTIDGTSGITTPTYNGADTSEYIVPVTAFKNRIINGAMMIDQRNAGASFTPTSDGVYSLDRWRCGAAVTSKYSVQRNASSVTPPAGFINYLGVTSLSSYSVGASESFTIGQVVEGLNISDLNWGTANAQAVTLSFWVRSSLTGTFGGSITNSAFNRAYAFTYTISSANTWEQKTITIAGDTTGTWLTTNGAGLYILLGLGTGSSLSGTANVWNAGSYFYPTGATSVVGTNGATWYITGVQLEKGSTATSFDVRPYGTELALAQRYYQRFSTLSGAYSPYGTGMEATTTIASIMIKYTVSMRSSPTIGFSTIGVYDGAATRAVSSVGSTYSNAEAIYGDFTHASGGTAARPVILLANASTSGYLDLSAEL